MASVDLRFYKALPVTTALRFGETVPATGPVLKAWTGSAWVAGVLKRWSGSAWVAGVLKRWDGSAWI